MSHTTDDMVFQWDPDVPLVVDENIELPQLQLVKNNTADCTQVYSTGQSLISNASCGFLRRRVPRKILDLLHLEKTRRHLQ